MRRDYRFENVVANGKRIAFTIHDVENFSDAKKRAVNFIIKKLDLNKDDFGKQIDYLTQNIENGETRVIPLKREEQLGLDFESKFNQTFEMFYNGLINEEHG